MDFAVALECYPPLFLTKTYTDEKALPKAYDSAQNFRFEIIPIADLAELAEVLAELDGSPRRCLVRGAIRAGATEPIWRRCWHAHPDAASNAAPLLPAEHHWACLDVDHCDTPFDPANPRASIEAWRETLPDELYDAALIFQLSSSAHCSATLRGHAWVWLARPASDTQVKRWAVSRGFDGSLFSPEHIHYTAAPLFASGEDPLAGRRLHWFDGEEVDVDLKEAPSPALAVTSTALVPTSDASYLAAGNAILGAIGSAGDFAGRKFWLVGALAGLLRRAGWPEETGIALIETWLNGHAEDLAHGLDWARQAWRKNADAVSGAGRLREFLPSDAADLVNVLAGQPMRTRVEALRAPPHRGLEFGDQEDEFGRVIRLLDEPPPPTYRVTDFEWGPGRPFGLMAVNNTGKTLLSRQMLLQYALGVPLLGRFAIGEQTSGRVLDLCYEQASQAAYTWSRLAKGLGVSIEGLGDRIVCRAPSRLLSEGLGRYQRDQETLVGLEDWLCRLCDGFDLAAVDPVSAALLGVDENSSQLQEPIRMLERVSLRTGCAMMVVVHMGRSGDHARGHSSLEDALDVSAHLLPDNETHRVLKCAKRVRKGWDPCSLEISDTPNGGVSIRAVGALAAEPEAHVAAHRILRFAQRMPGTPYSMSQLKQSCAISKALWPEAIEAAEAAGLVRRSGGKGGVVWLWVPQTT